MNRKTFLQHSSAACLGCGALFMSDAPDLQAEAETVSEEQKRRESEALFLQNWVSDLLDTIDAELDEETKMKLLGGCGKGCFNRHQFKRDLAEQGRGSLEKLISALKKNFEVWQEGDLVHIRYGEVSKQCYCPAARFRPPKPNDVHCYCTRATHQAIFETALGKPFRVDIVETLRRGGKTCHFVVHMS